MIGVIIEMYDIERNHNIPGFLGKSIKFQTKFENEDIKDYIQQGFKIFETRQSSESLMFKSVLNAPEAFNDFLVELGTIRMRAGTIKFIDDYQ